MNNSSAGGGLGRNVLKEKSYAFALRIVKLYKYLSTHKEYVLSKQVLRSGTAVGALVSESEFGQSKADFISKLSIGTLRSQQDSVLAFSTQRYWVHR